ECISGSSYAEAEKHKFANTQELQKYSESEQQEILEKPDKSILVTTIQEESNNNSKASSSKSSTASVRKNVIDRYCLRPLNEDQQKHFEQLILKATVSCGWAFSWVENSEVKALFQFIHPLIKLPSRKNLSGQILAESAQKITESTKEIAKNDKNGSLKTYKQNIGIPLENNEQIILEDNEEELSDDDFDYVNDAGEQNQTNVEQLEIVRCVNDWKVLVERW
ncbi:19523_t:CDS:2, partial [Gigaspora rosea]